MPAFDEWEHDLANAAKQLKLTLEPLPDDPESLAEQRLSVKKGNKTIGMLELEMLEPDAMSKAERAESIQAYGKAVEYQRLDGFPRRRSRIALRKLCRGRPAGSSIRNSRVRDGYREAAAAIALRNLCGHARSSRRNAHGFCCASCLAAIRRTRNIPGSRSCSAAAINRKISARKTVIACSSVGRKLSYEDRIGCRSKVPIQRFRQGERGRAGGRHQARPQPPLQWVKPQPCGPRALCASPPFSCAPSPP